VGAALFIAFRPAIFPTSTPTASPTRPIASTATEEVATVESPEVTEPPSDAPVTGLNPKDTSTETPTAEPTESTFAVDSFSLGESAQGRSLAGTRIGYEGDTHVVVVGSIQGDQTMTRALVRDLISYLERTPERVPEGTMYHLIPTINPDGNASNSRYNARGVDLNRNWDTSDWERDAAVPGYPDGKPGAGGSAPFSEQETRNLREYLQMLKTSSTGLRVIVLHSSVRRSEGEVYPGGSSSLSHAEAYAEATGYDIEYAWAEYVTSGEAVTWCEEQGIPSLDIVIPAAHDSQTRISSGLTLLEATVNALARVVQ
jgi:protein MpaA